MNTESQLFRIFCLSFLLFGLIVSVYDNSAGLAAVFGILFGTALERLVMRGLRYR